MIFKACASLTLFALSVAAHANDADYMQVGRYYSKKVTISAVQKDPLQQMVSINFPPSVQTVEGAYRYLLAPTGYKLAPINSIDMSFVTLSKNTLPVSQRSLQGKIIELLKVLAGSDFIVIRDDLLRLVAVDTTRTEFSND